MIRTLGFTFVLFGFTACAPLQNPSPLEVRNQHPAQLTGIHGVPRRSRPVKRAELGLFTSLSNHWLLPGTGVDAIVLDGEIVRTEVNAKIGLPGPFDLEFGVPFLHASGGFLDSFIEDWHDVFGFDNADRDKFPRDQFRMEAFRRQGNGTFRSAYEVDPHGFRTGDIPVFLSWFPWGSDLDNPFSLGVRGGIELPVGDEEDGYGNGEVDWYLGALTGWDGDGWSLFGWGGRSWIGDADTADDAGLSYPEVDSAGAGAEVGLTNWASGLVQVEWERSLLRRLRDSHTRSDQVLLWLGSRLALSTRFDLEVAVAEDLKTRVSPDVIFHVGFRYRW